MTGPRPLHSLLTGRLVLRVFGGAFDGLAGRLDVLAYAGGRVAGGQRSRQGNEPEDDGGLEFHGGDASCEYVATHQLGLAAKVAVPALSIA